MWRLSVRRGVTGTEVEVEASLSPLGRLSWRGEGGGWSAGLSSVQWAPVSQVNNINISISINILISQYNYQKLFRHSSFIIGPANYWYKEKWYVFWFYFLSIPVLRDTKIFTEYDKGERWETCLRGNNNQGPLRTVLFYSSRGDDLSKFGKIRRSKYIPSLKVLHFTNILNLNLKSYDNLEQFSHWFIQI